MLKNLASYELRELDWYFTSIGFYIKPLKAKLQNKYTPGLARVPKPYINNNIRKHSVMESVCVCL